MSEKQGTGSSCKDPSRDTMRKLWKEQLEKKKKNQDRCLSTSVSALMTT